MDLIKLQYVTPWILWRHISKWRRWTTWKPLPQTQGCLRPVCHKSSRSPHRLALSSTEYWWLAWRPISSYNTKKQETKDYERCPYSRPTVVRVKALETWYVSSSQVHRLLHVVSWVHVGIPFGRWPLMQFRFLETLAEDNWQLVPHKFTWNACCQAIS